MATCQSCRKRTADPKRKSITGRQLCPQCADQLDGLAAGLIASELQGKSGPESVGTAIATAGFFERLRARRRQS